MKRHTQTFDLSLSFDWLQIYCLPQWRLLVHALGRCCDGTTKGALRNHCVWAVRIQPLVTLATVS